MRVDAANRFRALLDDERVIAEALPLRLYARDGGMAEGRAGLVVLPDTTEEVVACVQLAGELGLPVVPRGSGTGLAGGAVPLDGALVISVARMRRVLRVDPEVPAAWVEPGVLNLDLSREVAHLGLHYAPDPSSQAACSIGGNVATNAGGPHCLSYGVTSQHVLGLRLVTSAGEVLDLGGTAPDPPGYDLRGLVVGSEGTVGVVTRICVRLTPNPSALRTMLVDFSRVREAGAFVSEVIAEGVVPAAMEMMDQRVTAAVEEFVHAGLPLDAAAVVLVEVDGTDAAVEHEAAVVQRVARENSARRVRVAADETERALLWKARKSAFAAVARIAPNYYLHDCVVPRTRLVPILEEIERIAERHALIILNVFHAGDGNLHPLIAFDRRKPEEVERVYAAGREIIEACVAAGGVLSGEHGIGLEKRDYMPLTFSEVDLAAQACARDAIDPPGRFNPSKVLPTASRCGEVVLDADGVPEGTWL